MAPLRDTRGRFMSVPAEEDVGRTEVFAFPKGMENLILMSEVVREAKIVKAREVAEYWKSIAPERGDKDPKGSMEPTAYGTNWATDYRESIKAHEEKDGRVWVGSTLMPLAGWLEYGSIHNPEHGYGARALAHFGGSPQEGDRTHKLFTG